jgi:hypothetical protein
MNLRIEEKKRTECLLRLAVFLTFLGHGMTAISGNADWLVYLETVGFSIETSKHLIILIGFLDVIVALVVLVKPFKLVVLWAVIWTFTTALIRPISGEPIWEFVERGVNWIVPLTLYILIDKKRI